MIEPVPMKIVRRLLIIAILLSAAVNAVAQDDDFPEYRPTPKIELSKNEKTALEAQTDPKKYLKSALELMDVRIKIAEAKSKEGDYDAMHAELGGFHALIDVTLEFLFKNETRRGKVLETFKRYEIALRGFAPRIENIRRDAPERYGAYILKLLKHARENRTKAIEPFFDDSVAPRN